MTAFLKRYFWATHLAMLALGVYIGTYVSGPSIESLMQTGSQILSPSFAPAPQLQATPLLQPHAPIQEGNLYGGSGQAPGPAPKLPSPPPPEAVPTTGPLNLKLIGTVVGSSEQTFAFIEDLNTQRRRLYRIGEVVQGAKILEISRNRVVLDWRGRREELLNLENGEATSPTTEATPEVALQPLPEKIDTSEQTEAEGATSTNILRVSDNEWAITRDELSRQFENLHQLLKEARLIPHFRDDQAAGFIVTRLSSKSFLEQIGLRNGDILTGINGQKLNTLEEALQAYQSLQSESLLQLEIERNQRKELFTYEIR